MTAKPEKSVLNTFTVPSGCQLSNVSLKFKMEVAIRSVLDAALAKLKWGVGREKADCIVSAGIRWNDHAGQCL